VIKMMRKVHCRESHLPIFVLLLEQQGNSRNKLKSDPIINSESFGVRFFILSLISWTFSTTK